MEIDNAAILVKKAALEYDKTANPILAPYDLTISQYKILMFLYSQPARSAKVVDIERCYSMTHPTAIGLLDTLEKKGFVTRIQNPEDGRSKLISLTEKADCLEPDLQELGEILDREFTQTLSAEERAQLVLLLQKLLQRPEQNTHSVNRRRTPTMDPKNNIHRMELAEKATAILNLYTPFKTDYQVSFAMAEADEKGLPRINAKLVRTDGVPFAESNTSMDKKLRHMKDQTAVIRPFYLPAMKAEFDETEANEFDTLDFDYAAIIVYNKDAEGNYAVKGLYFLPTDAFIHAKKPDADGVWRKMGLGSYRMHQISLDPRQKFARSLYMALRMSEALEYEYEKYGFFFSNP